VLPAQDRFALLDTPKADPCGLARPPLPLRLAAAQVKIQATDAEHMTALVESMQAENDLTKAELDLSKADSPEGRGNGLLRRMQARRDRNRMVRESENLSAKLGELAGVCAEVIRLRTELTLSERGRVHEIDILHAQSKMLRDKLALGPESLRAEADRYVAEANDVATNMKQVSGKLANAMAQRDQLKGFGGR
jgi:hypothetical protein